MHDGITHRCDCRPWRKGASASYLMSQDVDVVADVARRRRMLLLAIFALLRLLHLDLALHVGLLDHLHLARTQPRQP